MHINFNTSVNYQPKNIHFKAFTKKSEKIIREDMLTYFERYKDRNIIKDTLDLIEKENQNPNRTIKVSRFKRTCGDYVRFSYRNVVVKNNLTDDIYKTAVYFTDSIGYPHLINEINTQPEFASTCI